MSSPAIVGDHAYVASIEPALHCLDSKTGARLWTAPGVSHFGARGKDRVYASDQFGNVLVLDAKTGVPLGKFHTAEGVYTLVNEQTDRLYLVNDHGLAQCLHEIGVDQPVLYRHPLEEATAKQAAEAAKLKQGAGGTPFQTEEPAAGGATPFEPEEPPAAGGQPGDQPPQEQPADEPPADAGNPFDTF